MSDVVLNAYEMVFCYASILPALIQYLTAIMSSTTKGPIVKFNRPVAFYRNLVGKYMLFDLSSKDVMKGLLNFRCSCDSYQGSWFSQNIDALLRILCITKNQHFLIIEHNCMTVCRLVLMYRIWWDVTNLWVCLAAPLPHSLQHLLLLTCIVSSNAWFSCT